MDRHIFVSYSRADKQFIDRLCDDLRAANLKIWIDTSNLIIGGPFSDSIRTAINQSCCMIVVLSPDAIASEWVGRELDFALNLVECPLTVFPILVRGKPENVVPPSLSHIQWIDARHNYDTARNELITDIYQHLGVIKPKTEKTPSRWPILLGVILLLAAIVITWSVTKAALGSQVLRTPSLISMGYRGNGFNPRLINLRTAADDGNDDGIPIEAGQPLEFIDVTIWLPEDASGYSIHAEVKLENSSIVIGTTQTIGVTAGLHNLGRVHPNLNIDEDNSEAWDVQENWNLLMVHLVTYFNGQAVSSVPTNIRLNPTGTSLLWDTPKATFAAIVYSVNNGHQLLLDMRSATQNGINAGAGDTLTIHEVWYNSDAPSTFDLKTEGYITPGGYDADSLEQSQLSDIERGIHRLSFTATEWHPDALDQYLVFSLIRSDGTITDRLLILFNSPTETGLISRTESVLWPFEEVTYLDFEAPDAADDWTGTEISTVIASTVEAFTGSRSLAVTVTGNSEEDAIKAQWHHTFTGEVLIGQVYWPEQAGIDIEWAQACIWACVPIDIEPNRWNTFVMDISELTFQERPMNTQEVTGVLIQAQIEGVGEDNPYTFYVDGIQLYTTQ